MSGISLSSSSIAEGVPLHTISSPDIAFTGIATRVSSKVALSRKDYETMPTVESVGSSNSMHSYCKSEQQKVAKNKKRYLRKDEEETENSAQKPKKSKQPREHDLPSRLVEKVACYKCKFCLFLSMNEEAVALHIQQEHVSQTSDDQNDSGMQCPGCSNIFYSEKSMRVHLSEDHHVANQELEDILRSLGCCGPEVQKKKYKRRKKESTETQGNATQEKQDSSCVKMHGKEEILKRVGDSSDSKQIPSKCDKKTGNQEEMICLEQSSADETGKIRVRNLSSLESSNSKTEIEGGKDDGSLHANNKLTEKQNNLLSLIIEDLNGAIEQHANLSTNQIENYDGSIVFHGHSDSNVGVEKSSDSSIMKSVITLGQQQSEQHQQTINSLFEQQLQAHQPLQLQNVQHQSLVEECNTRYSATFSSQVPCEVMIDENCLDETGDHVFYVESGDLSETDEAESLVVCFQSTENFTDGSPGHAISEILAIRRNSEDVRNVIEASLSSPSKIREKKVKRGRVKGSTITKKIRRRKRSNLQSAQNSGVKVEPPQTGYGCGVSGCWVRLQSHDKLEYHQRCHKDIDVTNTETSEESKITCTAVANMKSDMEHGGEENITARKIKFRCPECVTEWRSWSQMSGHLWRSHSIDMELFSCDQCGYKTTSLSNLENVHKRIHGSEKPFLCDSCGKGFKTPKQLCNHKAVHVKKAKAAAGHTEMCSICGRTLSDARMLRSHMSTVHNKVRPYMCSQCGHTASNRSSLKLHLRQHTGDRPYHCDQCEYTTSDHNSLRRHKKRHTGDKPYKCPHCPYACIQSTTYKTHLRSKHPGLDGGLMFSCKKCPFHSVSHAIYLTHLAEHEADDSPQLVKGKSPKVHSRVIPGQVDVSHAVATAAVTDQAPIILSITTTDSIHASEAPSLQSMVEEVSEAIIPGSNLHLLYNSLTLNSESQS